MYMTSMTASMSVNTFQGFTSPVAFDLFLHAFEEACGDPPFFEKGSTSCFTLHRKNIEFFFIPSNFLQKYVMTFWDFRTKHFSFLTKAQHRMSLMFEEPIDWLAINNELQDENLT